MRKDISSELAVTTDDGLVAIIDLRNDNFVLLDINEAKSLRNILSEYVAMNEKVD